MPFIDSQPAEVVVHATAIRIAKQCVSIIGVCLRPEEVGEAEREFYHVVRASLEELVEGLARKGEQAAIIAETKRMCQAAGCRHLLSWRKSP